MKWLFGQSPHWVLLWCHSGTSGVGQGLSLQVAPGKRH